MEPIYSKKFTLEAIHCDCFGNCKPSALLYFVQEASGDHCQLLNVSTENHRLLWAILRHKLQITRLPRQGETLTLETWPMPTTRTAYPRSVIAYDGEHRELFRSIALWVLMDPDTRSLVLPGKSGITVNGILRGTELSVPGSLVPGTLASTQSRRVCYSDLDVNGHMNNVRYMDWIWDLFPSSFHENHDPKAITLCYLAEAREADLLDLHWQLRPEGTLQVEIFRQEHRIFAADIAY